jgi:predicted ATP-grasp superfamily ATP-dependent carboligase
MRVFAFEFFTGGGLLGRHLPRSLAHEGDLMLRTLIGELAGIPGVRVVISRDPRLPPLDGCQTLVPGAGEAMEALFARGVECSDAAWPTAPEGDGVLERLASSVQAAGRTLLGCAPAAVRLTASKRETARRLAASEVPVVPTCAPGETLPPWPGPWAVKPDDGAGCDGLELLPGRADAARRLAAGNRALVAQPWLAGEPWSLSLVCAGGAARLLACNRQQVRWESGLLRLDTITVNARPPADPRVLQLGAAVAAAIPGLWGYVGVDLLLGPDGPVVLEVNPRLTTSYCGLPAALDRNVAALVLDLHRTGVLPEAVAWSGRPVEIALHPEHAA